MHHNQAHVCIEGLHFAREQQQIFTGIDLTIPKGKITAIMGPSGTGKTTLLRLIGAQLTPDAGRILVSGNNLHNMTQAELFKARQKMSLLFQQAALFTHLNTFENVAFPLREHTRLPESLLRTIVLMKLETVGLRGAKHLFPHELSGGMARRVALARAIALDPEMIMYDEPFAGQDPIAMSILVKLIKSLNQSLGITSVIVSHDVPETVSIADHVYLLANGKIIGEGSPEEIGMSREPAVVQFLQGQADGVVPFHYPAFDYFEELLNG